MNGLFITNNCCSGVVVDSRAGLCMRGSGKSYKPQQGVQPGRG